LDRAAADHEAYAASRRRVYIGREEYIERLDAHAAGDGPPLVVLGASGGGKSALLANWTHRWSERHPAVLPGIGGGVIGYGLVVPLEVLGKDVGIQQGLGHRSEHAGRTGRAASFLIGESDNFIQQSSVFRAAKEAQT